LFIIFFNSFGLGLGAIQNFFMRAAQEMRAVTHNQFQLITDEFGDECLRYIAFSFQVFVFSLLVMLNIRFVYNLSDSSYWFADIVLALVRQRKLLLEMQFLGHLENQ
jgi:hypothetical protein